VTRIDIMAVEMLVKLEQRSNIEACRCICS